MNKIDEMIRELCPEGVKKVRVKDVAVRNKGINITAATMRKIEHAGGDIKVFAAGNTQIYALAKDLPLNCAQTSPGVIVKSRGNIDFDFCDVPYTHKSEMWSYGSIEGLEIKYLYYCLKIKVVYFQNKARANSVKLPQLCVADTDDFLIPLPPLPIQHEIVSVLDSFFRLQSKLEEELAVRQKQMVFYREKLLTFDENDSSVKWMKLGEVCEICNGYTPSKSNKDYWNNGTIPWFRLDDVRVNGRVLCDSILHITELGVKKGGLFPANSLMISTTATIGEYALITVPFVCNQQITVLSPCKSILPMYLFYCSGVISAMCKKNVNGQGLALVPLNKIKGFVIPVPSLSRQQEIVSTLDTMSSLIDKLKEEIELRKKQYEYYREALLSF